MVKKKSRQNSNSAIESWESSDTTCIKQEKTGCSHINKSVDLNSLRKNFRGNGNLSNRDCTDCKRLNCSTTEDIWLCLRCGNCSCGPDKINHGQTHFETPRSDSHSLSLKIENLHVWCYECRLEISANSSQKLHSCVDFVKQQRDKMISPGPKKALSNESGITDPLANNSPEHSVFSRENNDCKTNNKHHLSNSSKTHVKGLSNLGNTCFFNSVLQCLAQTPGLTDILKTMQVDRQKIKLHLGNDGELESELEKGGHVSKVLLELLTDMKTSDGINVLTPRKLLTQLRKKCPQFEGGDQHDAHELLRQLLDIVRMEDDKRYKSMILQLKGLSKKVVPEEVAEEERAKVKELYKKVSDNVTVVPDQIFKGILVSQLQCQYCFHTSDCVEDFLDLSLPVNAEKSMPPITRRKNQVINRNEEIDDNERNGQAQQLTCEVIRPLKASARRRRMKKNGQRAEDGQGEPSITEEDKKESSDADVEDNDVFTEDRKMYVNESGYSSEKLASSRTSPTTESRDAEDSACASPSSVPGVTWITDDLQLEEPNTQQPCEKNTPHRPESGLGSSIVSVQESNVSVLEPSDVPQSIDSSDSLKCNPSCASDARTLGEYLSNESNQDVDLYSQVSSEIDDTQHVTKCDDPLDENYCVRNSPVDDKDVPNLIVNITNADVDENPIKTYPIIADNADVVDSELINFNQSATERSNWDCNQQLARSSPIEVMQGESLDSKLLSMSLQSYNAEYLSRSPNQGNDFSLVAPTVPKDNLIEATEKMDVDSQPKETNVEMGFVLVGGVANNVCRDLSISITEEKTEVESPERNTLDTTACVGTTKMCNSIENNKENNTEECLDEVNLDLYKSRHITLAPRYQCSEGECSVLSCLNHFTAIEIMAGSNMVGCEACTRQNKGAKDKEPKTVYRVSTKRLLIHSPPPVLILHLKRFQVQRYSVRKLGCHVNFDDILDIAPICSFSVQKMLRPGQTQILYSLYGVVAHSGTLHGGHYFSYVKVRSGGSEECNPRQGTWYSISDSHTREVTADAVFKSEAYLLFYERFL